MLGVTVSSGSLTNHCNFDRIIVDRTWHDGHTVHGWRTVLHRDTALGIGAIGISVIWGHPNRIFPMLVALEGTVLLR